MEKVGSQAAVLYFLLDVDLVLGKVQVSERFAGADLGIFVWGGTDLENSESMLCNTICNTTYILQISLFATPFLQISLLTVHYFTRCI